MKKPNIITIIGGLFVAFLLVGPKGETGPQSVLRTDVVTQNSSALKIDADFGKMPLYFIANQGQLDKQVAYYVQGKDKTIYFTAEGITFALTKPGPKPGIPSIPGAAGSSRDELSNKIKWQEAGFIKGEEGQGRALAGGRERVGSVAERWAVTLEFVRANKQVKPIGDAETGGVVSYFKGKPKDWKTGIPTFSKIIYPNLWPGIDLVYHGNVNRLKYEFIVHPGADPSKILLAYRGASAVEVNTEGRLEVKTPAGDFADDRPVGYQEINGGRVDVALGYSLEERPAEGAMTYVYGFEVGDYDRTKPLVLDPAVLVYCGFIGGSYEDHAYGIAVDSSANVYVTGHTDSRQDTFPIKVGPALSFGGSYDAFIAKVNAAGTALVYCGYIGGSTSDFGSAIAVDASGNAYITGITLSNEASFPVTVGPDLTYNDTGYGDAFIAKVNTPGTALVYCGYIGGFRSDKGSGIAVDSSGNAYVAGTTNSETTFPVMVGPDLTYNDVGLSDAFVAKVNVAGTALVYCGYIGGADSETAYGIAVDGSGNAYVTGVTCSNEGSFPVSVGPDLTYNGGTYPFGDAFVAKVNPSGTTLSYCGYIGGSSYDYGYGIAVDASGNAYVTGSSDSAGTGFPLIQGPDLTFNGGRDAFVAKINAAGTAFVYCGCIGGSGWDEGLGNAVDSQGNAYIAGNTSSSEATFPVLVGPDLSFRGGYGDSFIAKVSATGILLIYCGYIGGSDSETAYGIAADGSGNAYVTGVTVSTETSFPVTVGPDLTYNGWTSDAFVAKVYYFDERIPKHAVSDFDGDGVDEVAIDFGAAGIYLYDDGTWSQISPANAESLLAADVDGDNVAEILADLSSAGLWLWNAGAWNQLSGVNVETLAAGDPDADGSDEIVGDFGALGLWLYNGGSWSQLSGVNADYVTVANADGISGDEIFGDFGATGLWVWNTGSWFILSGVNADYVITGRQSGARFILGDFGPTGLWMWSMPGLCTQLSGLDADYMIAANIDGSADDGIVGDFGTIGLWLWNSGVWTQLSGVNAVYMIRAAVNGDGEDEIAVDFGPIGLWLWDDGAWSQLSGAIAEYLMAGDLDGDNKDEIMADFGALGLWMWDDGAWSQISANNPD